MRTAPPPGHDGWVVGDEPNVLFELAEAVLGLVPVTIPRETAGDSQYSTQCRLRR